MLSSRGRLEVSQAMWIRKRVELSHERGRKEGNGNPLQYPCLENPMDGEAWWATVHGVSKSQTQLSDFTSHFLPYTLAYAKGIWEFLQKRKFVMVAVLLFYCLTGIHLSLKLLDHLYVNRFFKSG